MKVLFSISLMDGSNYELIKFLDMLDHVTQAEILTQLIDRPIYHSIYKVQTVTVVLTELV